MKRAKKTPYEAITTAATTAPAIAAAASIPPLRETAPTSSGTNTTSATTPSEPPGSRLASPLCGGSRFGHVDEVTRLYMEHCESNRSFSLTQTRSKGTNVWDLLFHRTTAVENRVCKDLVAHDHPGTNPFRQLIPLALEHPFLLHILVATSALHLFNTLHRTKFSAEQPPHLVASVAPPLGIVTNPEGPVDQLSKTALTNALAAKHRAICSLRSVLDRPDPENREIILTAILFFINFELIDVGNGGWQPHLRGAGRLMALLGQAQRTNNRPETRLLFDVVISDCLM